jgi:hypothetical protein
MSYTLQISRNTTLSNINNNSNFIKSVTPSAQFSGASNNFSANVFTPLSLSNYGPPCLYWYDAQDLKTLTFQGATNSVIAWNDKSGNGYNLLSNPVINTPLAYQTDPSNFKFITGTGLLSYIGPVNCEVMSFFIMYADQEPTIGQQKFVFGAIPSGINNSEDSLAGFIFQSSNNGPPSGPFDTFFFSGSRTNYTSTNFATQLPLTLFEFDVNQEPGGRTGDPSTIIQVSWVNGYLGNGTSFQAGGGGTRLSTAEGLSLNGIYSGGGDPTPGPLGSVYEIIGVSGPITEEARQKMTSYFAWKYGQKANVPQDNPYLFLPPRGTTW